MFRPPAIISLASTSSDPQLRYYHIFLLVEPVKGEVYRKDLYISRDASAVDTILEIERGWRTIARDMEVKHALEHGVAEGGSLGSPCGSDNLGGRAESSAE